MGDMQQKTAIVVPCYNEEKRLDADAFLELAGKERDISLIFVNDGSSDRTHDRIEELRAMRPAQIQSLDLERNSGKAEAVRRGVLKAMEMGFTYIGYWDADLSTPLYEIKRFTDILDGSKADIVMGSRVRLLGRRINRNKARHYLGRVFATFASLILQIPVYDTQCGAKIFRNNRGLQAAFKTPFRVRWTFDVEVLGRIRVVARAWGQAEPSLSWVEYPLDEWEDVKGSKLGRADFLVAGVELLKMFAFLHLPGVKNRYLKSITG